MTPEADRLTDRLVAAIARVQESLATEQANILAAGASETRAARLARISEMQQRLATELEDLRGTTRGWLARELPAVYRQGADISTGVIGGEFVWSQIHRDAVQALADDTFRNVLIATEYVDEDVKRWAREVGRMATEGVLIEGATPQQMRDAILGGKRFAGMPPPVGAVTYRNGAVHSLKSYGEMLVRTKSAQAFNSGTVNQATSLGVRRFETFDGSTCGWAFHRDTVRANARIVTAQQASATPLSHPNCRRGFGPRPDLDDLGDPDAFGPFPVSTTAAQRADQAAFETARAAARSARTARTPRTARTARTTPQPAAGDDLAAVLGDELSADEIAAFVDSLEDEAAAVVRPGDRFRNTGTWTEEIADDFDVIADVTADADHVFRWQIEQNVNGRFASPGPVFEDVLERQRRIGRRINDEVARREALDFPEQRALIAERRQIDSEIGDAFVHALKARSGAPKYFEQGLERGEEFRRWADNFVQYEPDLPPAIVDAVTGATDYADVARRLETAADELEAIAAGINARRNAISQALDEFIDSGQTLRQVEDIRVEVLSEIRDFGGKIVAQGGTSLSKAGVKTKVIEALDIVAERLPSDWVDRLNEEPITFVRKNQRAYAIQAQNVVNVGGNSSFSAREFAENLGHELTHILDGRDLTFSARAWGDLALRHRDRYPDWDDVMVADDVLAGIRAGTVNEAEGYLDLYKSHYTGRIYENQGIFSRAYEVNTTGIEGYLFGQERRYMLDGDDPFRDYIAGLLATA